jgi:uncharacterized protein YegJ (DUF2314 family)
MNPTPNHESNIRRIKLFALIGSLAFSALALNTQASNVVGRTVKQGSSEPEYFQVTKDHAAMHQAVTEARKTVKKFIVALKHPAPGQQDFEVKKPFAEGDQVEHIWLSDVRLVGNHFEGQIDNQPRKVQGFKLGQLVSVKPKEISDWLYIDNGKLVGGYTVRAHYNELSPQQKQEFDRDADFKIGQP